MVEKISNYVETIITLIVAITIIELILPNNKNKKYVMFVCSVVIMLAVINPMLSILNSDFNISSKIDEIQREMKLQEYNSATNYNLDYNIYNTYINNLKSNMETRLKDIGYEVLDSQIKIDNDTYEPTEIEMKVKHEDGYIQPIVIDVFENATSDNIFEIDINRIKETLSANYGIDKNNIKINE